jgi:hypothetical protein
MDLFISLYYLFFSFRVYEFTKQNRSFENEYTSIQKYKVTQS